MKKATGILLVVTIASVCVAAQTINIADTSDAASRISLKGTVKFDRGTYCSLLGTNESSKPAQKVAVLIKITRPNGVYADFTYIHTHKDGIARGQQFTVSEEDCSPTVDFAMNVRQTTDPPSATAETIAVRYMDGTTWGNQKVFQ